ncbi:MAG: hypothetical protein LRY40_01295 [Shewanella fodinae]|jgi:hypothetical protein|nr:hypothetical protein [Shewanella fodinae]
MDQVLDTTIERQATAAFLWHNLNIFFATCVSDATLPALPPRQYLSGL